MFWSLKNVIKIFLTVYVSFLSICNGLDFSNTADGISFDVHGLFKGDTPTDSSTISYKVSDITEYIENLKFGKVDFNKIKKVQINMNQFVDKQGVRVEFKSSDGIFLSIFLKDKNGQYYMKSVKSGELKLYCSVHRCEPGIIALSKTVLKGKTDLTTDNIIGAFLLEFYSKLPYKARIITTRKDKPHIYVCPGLNWNHGSGEFYYDIHSDSEYWYDKSKNENNILSIYNGVTSWDNLRNGHGSLYPVPMVESKKGGNLMICGTLKRKTNSEILLQWAYEIKSDESQQNDNIPAVKKTELFNELLCDLGNAAVTYFTVGYLPHSETKNDIGRFIQEPSKTLRNIFYKYHILFYKKTVLAKELTMNKEYVFKNGGLKPECVKIYSVNEEEVTAKFTLNAIRSSTNLKKHKYNDTEYNMFEIDNAYFESFSKINIQCKVESTFTGPDMTDENKLLFKNFYTPYFDMGVFEIKDNGREGKFISNGFINFKKNESAYYGMYKCSAKNYKKYRKNGEEENEKFLILPKNGLIIEEDPDVAANGDLNKHCELEFGSIGYLDSITMEHNTKVISVDVNKIQGNEYFELITKSGKKCAQLKSDLEKGDILKCHYKTKYNTVFYRQVSFMHQDDFVNSEAAKDSVKRNVTLIITISIVLFLFIILGTISAFIAIRNKRRRKRLLSLSESGESLSGMSKGSKGSLSNSNSRNVSKSNSRNVSKSGTRMSTRSGSKAGSKSGARSKASSSKGKTHRLTTTKSAK